MRSAGGLGAVLVAVALVLVPPALPGTGWSLAHAQAPPAVASSADQVAAVRKAAARLDYAGVRTLATTALASSGNTRDALIELYHHLGTANAILGDEAAALDAFTRLLAIDPEHRLSAGLSPKVTSPFREAGGYWIDRPKGISLSVEVPADAVAGRELRLPVTVYDPLQMAKRVVLHHRVRGAQSYATVDVELGLSDSPELVVPEGTIPSSATDVTLEYYLVLLDPSDGDLAGGGSATVPLTAVIAATPGLVAPVVVPHPAVVAAAAGPKAGGAVAAGPSIFKTWWFWTAVGAVAVGAGGTIYYLESRDSGVDLSIMAR